jgi:hypothetical protein
VGKIKTGTVRTEPNTGRIKTKAYKNPASDTGEIKRKQGIRELFRSGSGREVKTTPRIAGKPFGMFTKEIRAGQSAVQKRSADYGTKAVRQMAVKSVRTSLEAVRSVKKTTKTAVKVRSRSARMCWITLR